MEVSFCFKCCYTYLANKCFCPRQEVVSNHQHLSLLFLWTDPNLKSGPESSRLNLLFVPSCQDYWFKHLQGEMKPCFYCHKSQTSPCIGSSCPLLSNSTETVPNFTSVVLDSCHRRGFVNVFFFSFLSFLMQRKLFAFSYFSFTFHYAISTRSYLPEEETPSSYRFSTRSTKLFLHSNNQMVESILRSYIQTKNATILKQVIATADAEKLILLS